MLGHKATKVATTVKGKKREAPVQIEGHSEETEEEVLPLKRSHLLTPALPLTTSLRLQSSFPDPQLIEPSSVPTVAKVRLISQPFSTPIAISVSSAIS